MDDIRVELKRAIDTETQGFAFYTCAAELVKDERGKAVFRRLAKDELDHIRALVSLSKNLTEEGEWLSFKEAVQLGRGLEEELPIFPTMEEVLGWLSDDPTDTEVLRFGIGIEKRAVDYYSRVLEGADSPEAVAFFSSMVRMEEDHKRLLEWEYDHLVSSGFWCDHQEFTVEGEK